MHFSGAAPIYVQIADDLRRQILTGSLPEGAQVMSTTSYATTYRINPATAAKAFTQLIDEQLLEKRRGIGMFVRTGAWQRLQRQGRDRYWATVFEPALDQAISLGLDESDLVEHLRSYLQSHTPSREEDPR